MSSVAVATGKAAIPRVVFRVTDYPYSYRIPVGNLLPCEQPEVPLSRKSMARPVIEVEMLPVTKDEDARNDCESKTKTAKDVDTCQSETEDLIRMLQEALDLRDDGAEKKSPARSRPLSARSSMSSTSSSRVVTRSSSSLSAEAVRKIEKENARLLQRITKTAGKRKMAGQHPAIDRRVETSSMVNRRRADERISRENAVFHSFILLSFSFIVNWNVIVGAFATNSVCETKSFCQRGDSQEAFHSSPEIFSKCIPSPWLPTPTVNQTTFCKNSFNQ